jgi:hypothetical protein
MMMTTIPTATTEAFRMFDGHDGGRLCEVPVRVPGPGDARLQVGAMNSVSQICMHLMTCAAVYQST